LKHDDGTSDGMQSYGGAGHAIRFECPGENGLLTGISVYGSRYGNPQPPDEDFTIQILGDFGEYGLAVQTVIEKPYSLFERGDPKWVDIDFEATKVPNKFWVLLDFNAHQTKGVYVHYDKSNEKSYSMKAVPDGKAFHLEEIDKTWNWMIRAHLIPGKPSTEEAKSEIAPHPVGPIKIVSTLPEVGATDVDPGLSEITVTFDRPMNTDGYSWTGGGPNFPKTPEGKEAYWKDEKTCALPVELEAGHYYRVGINSDSYRNFRSESGKPAQPSAIYFTTKGATEGVIQRTRVPEVVNITPPNGAENVDPNLSELRVEFTVPMAGGYSWCGGGDHFPEIPEGKKPYWSEDRKTCFLPVKLKPNWEYHLGINCPSFRNFQSEGGIAVEPMGYSFRTAGGE
ncbi:MAG: hypothetical protein KC964_28875, partial [Candidatus Omnitrophica bacterium]|nr:hypothetical protein [Candidatus Omnitrophota bacterium]